MEISIRKLNPTLAEDYVRFFDITPHWENKNEDKCYCVTWRSDSSYSNNAPHWFSTREERRKYALQFVKEGSLQGYLAYLDDEIVGWCNANGDCRLALDYLRSYWPIEKYPTTTKVKSIFCFMIAPQVQRMGVATRLLEHVCLDAATDGFDYVEAYANRIYAKLDFRGPVAMYEKCGFSKFAEHEGKVVMRKGLK